MSIPQPSSRGDDTNVRVIGQPEWDWQHGDWVGGGHSTTDSMQRRDPDTGGIVDPGIERNYDAFAPQDTHNDPADQLLGGFNDISLHGPNPLVGETTGIPNEPAVLPGTDAARAMPSPTPPNEAAYQVPSVTVNGGGPDYAGFHGDTFTSGDHPGPIVETSPGFEEWWKQTIAPVSPPAAAGGDIWSDPAAFDVPPVSQQPQTADVSWPNPDSFDAPSVGQAEPTADVQTQNPDAFDVPPVSNTSPDLAWPNPDAFDVPSTGTASEPGGITNYGSGRQGSDLRNTGNNLTIGEFLNTPLALMNWGGNHFPVSGGRITAGGTTTETPSTGAVQIDPATGRPYDLSGIPGTDQTIQYDQNGNQTVHDNASSQTVGQNDRSGVPQGDPSLPGFVANPANVGYPNFEGTHFDYAAGTYVPNRVEPGMSSQMLMEYAASQAGNPNSMAYSPEEGTNRYNPGRFGFGPGGANLARAGNESASSVRDRASAAYRAAGRHG